MEPQQKRHSPGIVTAVVSLAAVCVFWAVYFAYRHQTKPQKPRSAEALLEELRTIKPPEGAQVAGIGPLREQKSAFVTVVANYTADSNCQAIAEHYKKEFALQGFVYKIRDDEKPDSEAMAFCGHDKTHGSFSCISEPHGQHYLISLRWPENTC